MGRVTVKGKAYGPKPSSVKRFFFGADEKGFGGDANLSKVDKCGACRRDQVVAPQACMGCVVVGDEEDTFRRGFWCSVKYEWGFVRGGYMRTHHA